MRHPCGIVGLACVLIVLAGCGSPAPVPATPEVRSPIPEGVAPPRVVFLGDSITAGYGLSEEQAFPALVGKLLEERGTPIQVVNAGVSGDTTAGGLARLDWVLSGTPEVLVVELGGNDGLRGQPLDRTEANLRAIVEGARAAGAVVVLAGMDVPTSYGGAYATAFAAMYPRIAEDLGAVPVPRFLHDVAAGEGLLQADGIHPTAAGHQVLARLVAPKVEEALELASRRN